MLNCKKCGAVIPDKLDTCLICGSKYGEDAPQESPLDYIAVPAVSPAVNASARRHPKRLVLTCVFLCFLLIFAAVAVWAAQILPYYLSSSGTRAKNSVIYLTGDGELKFSSPLTQEPETLAQNFGRPGVSRAEASSNGRYIAYIRRSIYESTGSLYLRDLAAKPTVTDTVADDILIEKNVMNFLFTENNSHIIYTVLDTQKTDSWGNKYQTYRLYSYDFTQSCLLDENVGEVIGCSDGKILYLSNYERDGFGYNDPDNPRTLYVGEYLSGANNKSVVAEDVLELVDHTSAFDKFVFTVKQDSGKDIAAVDLKQNMRQTLATGVHEVISADAKTFTVLYQTMYINPLHYDSIVNDDLAREDDKIDEPSIDDYPLLREFYEKYGEDASYEGSMDYEDIAEESAKLDAAIDVYDKMREREKRRTKIKSELDEFVREYEILHDLYLCRNGDVTRLSESSYAPFDSAVLDVSGGVISWRETGIKNFEKLLFSRYDANYDANTNVSDMLAEKLTDSLFVQKFDSSPIQVSLGKGSYTCTGWQLTSKSDGIYFAMSNESPTLRMSLYGKAYTYRCSLYFAPIENNSLGNIQLADENVSAVGEMLDGNRLLYYKNIEDISNAANGGRPLSKTDIVYVGDLYMMTGAVGQRIGEDVFLHYNFLTSENNGNTLLFRERYSHTAKSGNLFMYTKQNRQLATDVDAFYYRNDSLVYFMRNRRGDIADLYSFGSDGLVLVENNVAMVME